MIFQTGLADFFEMLVLELLKKSGPVTEAELQKQIAKELPGLGQALSALNSSGSVRIETNAARESVYSIP